MSQSFFVAWPVWEKLVFLLGCALVVTIMAGTIKLIYSHIRLRRLTFTLEQEKLDEKAEWPEVNTVEPAVKIPFGIKALQNGLSVEGVWYSRSNTPESPAETARAQQFDLDDSNATHPRPRSTHETEKITVHPDTQDNERPSRHRPHTSGDRHYPPLSALRYAGEVFATRDSSRSPASYQPSHGPRSTSLELDRSDVREDNTASASRTRQHSADFVLLDRRRDKQAAETGQLTPRSRNSASSDRPTTSHRSKHHSLITAQSPAGHLNHSSSAPRHITPFQEFMRNTPPSPTQHTMPAELEGSPVTSRVAQMAPTPTNTAGQDKRQSFDRLQTAADPVLRGHGSGFEILRPGTFASPAPKDSVDFGASGRRKLQKHNRGSSSVSSSRSIQSSI